MSRTRRVDPYRKELEALALRLRVMANAYDPADPRIRNMRDYYAAHHEAYTIAAEGIEEVLRRHAAKPGGLFDETA